jgi:transposase-like protein
LDTKRNGKTSAAPAGLSGPLQPLQRFLCTTCHATFTFERRSARPRGRFTDDFVNEAVRIYVQGLSSYRVLATMLEQRLGKSVSRFTLNSWVRDEWFALLDNWGAPGRKYREIADWLTGKHGISKWWAQKLIVEYEQERGLRPPGVRPDGTFEVSASKTVAVPAKRLFEAFVNPRERRKWLTDGRMSLRTSQPGRSARFDWGGGSTRVNVGFVAKGRSKATVAVSHERLADADEAEATKAMWKERLSDLKSFIES